MAMIKCPECGQEISDKAKKCVHCGKVFFEEDVIKEEIKCGECNATLSKTDEICPNCGCPIEKENIEMFIPETLAVKNEPTETISEQPKKQSNTIKKVIPIVILVTVITVIIGIVYNINVLQPKKLEAKNKAIYDESISLLEKGKYDEAKGLLQDIESYKDVDTILEQIKWESRVYECITDVREYMKNPYSLQVYEVAFYDGFKTGINDKLKSIIDDMIKLAGDGPVCVMRRGGENSYGANTIGYSLFMYSETDGVYKFMGGCETLNENDIDKDDEEELTTCKLINIYRDNLEAVGDVDLARIKTIIKNVFNN